MNEEPPLVDLRVDLARPTYPVLLFPCVLVAPVGAGANVLVFSRFGNAQHLCGQQQVRT